MDAENIENIENIEIFPGDQNIETAASRQLQADTDPSPGLYVLGVLDVLKK